MERNNISIKGIEPLKKYAKHRKESMFNEFEKKILKSSEELAFGKGEPLTESYEGSKNVLTEAKGETPQDKRKLKEILRNLQDMKEDIEDLKGRVEDEINDLARVAGGSMIAERAKHYWLAHWDGAIDKSSSKWLGGSMTDMASTLEEIEELINDAMDDDSSEDDED